MKKLVFAIALLVGAAVPSAHAFDIKDILGGTLGNAGGVVSGLVDGLLTQSDITVAQMAGTWTATGSAVCFQSDDFLKKAGGSAAAGAIEQKLNPYFQKYGLTGSVLTIDDAGNFTLKVKNVPLKGTIVKRNDGNFDFNFNAFGSFKIGSIKAYVEKPVSGLNVMFDASKLLSLITTVTKITGNSIASTVGSLLGSYDGLCVGFAYSGTGSSQSAPAATPSPSESGNIKDDVVNKAGNVLKGILGK